MPARSPLTLALGLAISDLRLMAGLTQEDLGKLSGTHPKYVGAVERGEKDVGWQNFVRFALALEMRPRDLAEHAERFAPIE